MQSFPQQRCSPQSKEDAKQGKDEQGPGGCRDIVKVFWQLPDEDEYKQSCQAGEV